MDPVIHDRFLALLRQEDLADPSWILALDSFDEPPLFSRLDQVEFLRALPPEQRTSDTLQVALSLIEKLAEEAERGAPDRIFFVCATFSDFAAWRAGEQLVPTPAIHVDPRHEETPRSDARMVGPYSMEAIAVASWLTRLGPDYAERFCVGELTAGAGDPALQRVYVGWRTNPARNVRSIGDELSQVLVCCPHSTTVVRAGRRARVAPHTTRRSTRGGAGEVYRTLSCATRCDGSTKAFDLASSACGAIAPIGEGPEMSQFMLVQREVDTRGLPAVVMSAIDVGDEFVRAVATEHFGDWRQCRLVTDASGGGESLIDDVCDAQLGGAAIEETTFVRFLKVVVEAGVRFVIWHGSDHRSLPTARSWSDVLDVLGNQTRLQPADVYLSFVPPDGDELSRVLV